MVSWAIECGYGDHAMFLQRDRKDGRHSCVGWDFAAQPCYSSAGLVAPNETPT